MTAQATGPQSLRLSRYDSFNSPDYLSLVLSLFNIRIPTLLLLKIDTWDVAILQTQISIFRGQNQLQRVLVLGGEADVLYAQYSLSPFQRAGRYLWRYQTLGLEQQSHWSVQTRRCKEEGSSTGQRPRSLQPCLETDYLQSTSLQTRHCEPILQLAGDEEETDGPQRQQLAQERQTQPK